MESCPTQAVLPLVGLATEKVIRDRYGSGVGDLPTPLACSLAPERLDVAPVRSLESRREALAVATDPETANFSEL
ncbi:MAG: hypothetical protein R6U98_14910, partial [Pirellulaceae bacterium]